MSHRPKTTRSVKAFVYESDRQDAGGIYSKDRAACTVIALAGCTGCGYKAAYHELEKAGRKHRRGFRMAAYLGEERVVFGHKFYELGTHSGKTIRTFADTFREGVFLVGVRQHVTTIIDGVILDPNKDVRPGWRIKHVWEVTKHEIE